MKQLVVFIERKLDEKVTCFNLLEFFFCLCGCHKLPSWFLLDVVIWCDCLSVHGQTFLSMGSREISIRNSCIISLIIYLCLLLSFFHFGKLLNLFVIRFNNRPCILNFLWVLAHTEPLACSISISVYCAMLLLEFNVGGNFTLLLNCMLILFDIGFH